MAGGELLVAIAVGGILLAAKLGEDLVSRLRLPGFLGSLGAGLVLGPSLLGLVDTHLVEEMGILLSIGINFTLFLAGVEELSNPLLLRPSRRELLWAVYAFAPGLTAVALYAWLGLGLDPNTSILYASAAALISLGPLAKILLEAEHGLTGRVLSALRVGLVAELAGILVFNTFYHGATLYSILATPIFVAGIIVFGRSYLDRGLRLVERILAVREAPFAIIVALVLLAGYLAELMGFNAAITALMLGVFASTYLHERPAYLERMRAFTYGFLEPLFFAGIGLYAPRPGQEALLVSGLLIAIILPPRILAALGLGFPAREALVLGAKGGIDAAMLLALYLEHRITGDLYAAGVLLVVVSTVLAGTSIRTRGARPELWRMKLKEIQLGHDAVYYLEKASYASRLLADKGALVVVGDGYRPIGYITAEDLLGAPYEELEELPVHLFTRPEVPIVDGDTLVADVLADTSILHEPIIAVVDGEGRLIGTLKPQQLLMLATRKH